MIKTIGIFCGARSGNNPNIVKLVSDISREIVEQDMTIVCGGSDCGLMKIIIDSALDKNGKVMGVFPDTLNNVEPHAGLVDLIRVPCLSSRKQKMMDIADAFLVLPGGYGTLDEIFEIIMLRKLNANQQPIILFNYNGFWDYLLKQIDLMVQEGFIEKEDDKLFIIVNDFKQFQLKLNTLINNNQEYSIL